MRFSIILALGAATLAAAVPTYNGDGGNNGGGKDKGGGKGGKGGNGGTGGNNNPPFQCSSGLTPSCCDGGNAASTLQFGCITYTNNPNSKCTLETNQYCCPTNAVATGVGILCQKP